MDINNFFCRHKFGKTLNAQTNRIGSSGAARFPKQKIECKICNNSPAVELHRYPEHYRSCHDKEFSIAGRKVSR